MIDEVHSLLNRYWRWLQDETGLRQVGDWVEITTPYLDRHNDCLQIYAKANNDGFLLTDDGYTVEDLEHSGCALDSDRRQALLRATLNGFGVRIDGNTNALEVRASTDDFALRKHNLVQAMLAVNDLFYAASSTASPLFHEDVVAWLDSSDVRYTPDVTFTGKSGYGHRFDFVIPKVAGETGEGVACHQPTESRHGASHDLRLDRHEGSADSGIPCLRDSE